jgi:hypothetical protein
MQILSFQVTFGFDTAPAVGAGVRPAKIVRGYSTNDYGDE